MHGNTGIARKVDANGQLPLICGVHDNHVCKVHNIPMQMIVERRERSRGRQERVRYRCPLCESTRRVDVSALIKRLEAGDYPQRLGIRQRDLLPRELVERYDAAKAAERKVKDKEQSVRSNFKLRLRKFGVSEEKHRLMVQEQDGCCAICGVRVDDPMSLHIDHCHESGHVRGLLCGGCNTGLGHFRDNVVALEKAAQYLRERGAA